MNKIYLPCFFLCGLFSHNIASADASVQFPTGPAEWAINVTASSSSASTSPSAGGQPRILTIVVTQDDEKRRSVITWSNGQTTEKWEIPRLNLILSADPLGHAFAVLGGGVAAGVLAIPFTPSSFSWLEPGALVEKDPISYQGVQCFHYQTMVSRQKLGDNNLNSGMVKAEAWIESKTLLPVALDDGTGLGAYTFRKDPPPPLTLPVKFQNVFDSYEQSMGILKPVTAH